MKRKLAQKDLGEGNIRTSPKRISASNYWIFTYNNYPEDWMALMAQGLEGCKWICEHEVGDGTDDVPEGTPHLQGYVEFPVKVRPIGYKGFPEQICWHKRKGTKEHNVNYCSKDFRANKEGSTELFGNLKPKIDMTCTDDDVIKYDDIFDRDWETNNSVLPSLFALKSLEQ